MPTYTATDDKSTIEWQWLDIEDGLIDPDSMRWSLKGRGADARLRALLQSNDSTGRFTVSGGHTHDDIRPYIEGVLQALEVIEEEFDITFHIPVAMRPMPPGIVR